MAGPRQSSEQTDEFLNRLQATLESLPIGDWRGRRTVVAFSGGVDSSVLLHGLGCLRWPNLTAVHVDHGLQPAATDWAAHCQAEASRAGIACTVLESRVESPTGGNLEAAARDARYRALREVIGPNDVLMTAHHGDDQLETVLLRIMRGTGVRGLAAILSHGRFGKGWLARPLLGFSRDEISSQAHRWDLQWVEDPMNVDSQFDRSFLRNEVLAHLKARWPAAHRHAERLSRHMATAERLLGELAASDLAGQSDLEAIEIDSLTRLAPDRRSNALRYLIRSLGLPSPSERQLKELDKALQSRSDGVPLVCWPGAEARIYRGRLYLMTPLAPVELDGGRIAPEQPWLGNAGRLELERVPTGGIPDRLVGPGLDVQLRAGGERVKPAGLHGSKPLKQWFQEQGILPWMRNRVPLLVSGGEIVAVADFIVADFSATADEPGWLPVWTPRERIR